MPKVNKLIFHNFNYLVRPSVRLRFARIINSYAVDWSVGLFLSLIFFCFFSFIGFLFQSKPLTICLRRMLLLPFFFNSGDKISALFQLTVDDLFHE